MFNLSSHQHRRYNPLLGEWLLVSPHRTQRPCQDQVEQPTKKELLTYNPACYLCPGNECAVGISNIDTFLGIGDAR